MEVKVKNVAKMNTGRRRRYSRDQFNARNIKLRVGHPPIINAIEAQQKTRQDYNCDGGAPTKTVCSNCTPVNSDHVRSPLNLLILFYT